MDVASLARPALYWNTHAATGMRGGGIAGPHANGVENGLGGTAATADPKLIQFLTAHQGHARYFLATLNATTAAPYVLETGKPIMALGGFMGGDRILTLTTLQRSIATGQVGYFLLPARGRGLGFSLSPEALAQLPPQLRDMLEGRRSFGGFGPFGGLSANTTLSNWVSGHCTVVPSSQWSTTHPSTRDTTSVAHPTPSTTGHTEHGSLGGFRFGRGGTATTLYDCTGM
jgi:hypothetical protein